MTARAPDGDLDLVPHPDANTIGPVLIPRPKVEQPHPRMTIALTLSVSELIEKLQRFNPELAVMLWCTHCGYELTVSGAVVEVNGCVILAPGDARDVEISLTHRTPPA